MNTSGMDESFALQKHGRRSLALEAMLESGSPAVREQQMSKTFKRRSATLNVQRSLQLLDESVSSPSSRGLRTPGGSLRHSSYTPRQNASSSKFDVSARLGPTPKKTPQGNRSLNRSGIFGEEMFSTSMNAPSGTSMTPLPEEDMTEEVTTTNVGLLLEEDPGILASNSVYQDFLQRMRDHSSQGDMFTLLHEYENICRGQVVMLKKLVSRATKHEEKFGKIFQVLHLLGEEEDTWKLIRVLFKDRLSTAMQNEFGMEQGDSDQGLHVQGIYQSDHKIMTSFFERESSVRESQIVVDWLENCAYKDFESYSENVKFFSDRAVGYENARHRLQNRQSGMPVGSERPLVTELDPDAPLRQNKLLDDLDKEDEDRLLQYIFVCLRAGQLEKAQHTCTECGQAWRAASLEGWRLFHDPNFDGLGPECQRKPISGNPYRDVWKTVCWNMAQDPRIGSFERAIYSIQSGNLRGVLPVCKSWLDYLWAYFHIMIDLKVEEEVRLKTTVDRTLESLPGEYWEKNLDPRLVFKEMEANEGIRTEAFTWFHVIQKHLILNDSSGLIDVMYEWVRHQRKSIPLHLLRFMTHLVLFLRTSEQSTKEELANIVIESYVEEIIKEKHHRLVAYYVAKLPPDAQVHWYAKFLEAITEKDERQMYLDLAENAGLDVIQITKRVVENIRSHSEVDFSRLHRAEHEAVDTVISEEDRRKIEAIDWLVFDVAQRSEALKQANAVMRAFIAMKKLVAAKEVFDKLPPDSVDVVHRTWHQITGMADLMVEDSNAVREYLCIKAYLDAMESFNDWFNHYHHGKPAPPAAPEGGSFTDKVAYEHRLKQYDQEQNRWRHNLLLQTKTTKEHIYNVLLFADGGWMVDPTPMEKDPDDMYTDDAEVDPQRQDQMDGLRRLVLPGLVFLLHNVLHTSEQYQECVQLADVVSLEQHRLYEVFRKDELQRLLMMIRESSLPLLDQGRGPLGYELS